MAESSPLPSAVVVDATGAFRTCSWEEVAAGITVPDGGYSWLIPDATSPVQATWLSTRSGIAPIARRSLGSGYGRPGAQVFDSALLITMRGVNLNTGEEPSDMVTVRAWVESTRLITVRHQRVRSYEEVFKSFEAQGAPSCVGDLLLRIAGALTTHISNAVARIDEQVDAIEDKVLADGDDPAPQEISSIRREATVFRRQVAPQRELFELLAGTAFEPIDVPQQLAFRDLMHRAVRHVDDLESLKERGNLMREEVESREATLANRRVYVFTLIAGIFLPLGFLTGLLGINVGGIPGAENPQAFLWVCLITLGFGFGAFLLLRLSRWV